MNSIDALLGAVCAFPDTDPRKAIRMDLCFAKQPQWGAHSGKNIISNAVTRNKEIDRADFATMRPYLANRKIEAAKPADTRFQNL